MGEPNNPCFKPISPFISWINTTTTTTSTPAPDNFFILPSSGVACPVISFDINNNFKFPPILNNDINTFICESNLYDPNPCIINVQKYLRVADINIDINKCNRYKIVLSNIVIPTTTTTTTTIAPTTTTTNNPITTSTTTPSPFGCNTLRYTFGATNVVQYGSYAIGTVTASDNGPSAPIWGNNSYGYTDDSRWNRAVIHAGLLSAGQTAQIKFTLLGSKNTFPSSSSNGIVSSPWLGNWCAVSLELA